SLADFLAFQKAVKFFLKKDPKIIACDLHPEYESTKYARSLNLTHRRMESVQHHHAHIASCMAENNLKNQKVIGVAFDGTGLGDDNTLWGAEFLTCDYKNFTRCGHLKTIPLLGQEMAIREPWRLAAIWLYWLYKDRFLDLGLTFTKKINKQKWQVLKNMYLTGFNSPPASSMGRLFDAAASLILAKSRAGFEGELAIKLEKLAAGHLPAGRQAKTHGTSYRFNIIKKDGIYIIEPLPMFQEIVRDLKKGLPKEEIASCFHTAIAKMISRVCVILRKDTRINKVVLSGGVFQNKLLLKLSLGLLYEQGFKVFIHQKLSSNDSGIALGQLAIANFRS
ncbi:MAG: carbamoyltransferase HypF, partial [Candidatus Omnitrophica bacterium]|nr:carbamoyltransferase HypF [Candidatus Omnitrophota bacterium]